MSTPDLDGHRDRTPVVIDDIISTGRTMIETLLHLRALARARRWRVGVHAVAADRAHDDLLAAGAARVVTCDTIAHPSNWIAVGPLLADGVRHCSRTDDGAGADARTDAPSMDARAGPVVTPPSARPRRAAPGRRPTARRRCGPASACSWTSAAWSSSSAWAAIVAASAAWPAVGAATSARARRTRSTRASSRGRTR
ncbi:MAG: hypothetical protein IPL61_04735 [Myxococcales bacterium]|nr:hypothetical protein [Myxococcales bacterium]